MVPLIASKLIEVKPLSLPSGVYHYFDTFGSFGDIRVESFSDYSLNFQKKLMQDLFDTAFVDEINEPYKIWGSLTLKSPNKNDEDNKIMPG